jgi:hypothetical protein
MQIGVSVRLARYLASKEQALYLAEDPTKWDCLGGFFFAGIADVAANNITWRLTA